MIPRIDPENPPPLEPLLAAWQAVLRLQDWDITAHYVRHVERSCIRLDAPYKRAIITMMHPHDWNETPDQPYDLEKKLVHELCHVPFAALNTGGHDTLAGFSEEQAVESFARAFVSLRRFLVVNADPT